MKSLPAVHLLKYWLPVVLWCLLIFGASSDSQSGARTSRIIGPLIRWLMPNASAETVERIQFGVRKAAHVTEYAVLALLLWRACRSHRAVPAGWHWPDATIAFAATTLFAVTDEWHQAYVPNRQAHPMDIVLDAAGGALALWLLWLWGKRFRRW